MTWMLVVLSAGCNQDWDFETQTDPPTVEDDLGDSFVLPTDDTGEFDVPVAQMPLYANTSERLYTVDPQSGDVDLIGQFRDESSGVTVDGFIDIGINRDGVLYGGTFESLYIINPETASVRWICDVDADFTAMTFTDSGELIAGAGDTIRVVNVDSCEVRTFGTPFQYITSGDIVGLPDGHLYWSVRDPQWDGEGNGRGDDHLIVVDPQTGFSKDAGLLGLDRLYGMGYYDDKLFGFSSDGEIVRVHLGGFPVVVEATQVIANLPEVSWWGATTNPVNW